MWTIALEITNKIFVLFLLAYANAIRTGKVDTMTVLFVGTYICVPSQYSELVSDSLKLQLQILIITIEAIACISFAIIQ